MRHHLFTLIFVAQHFYLQEKIKLFNIQFIYSFYVCFLAKLICDCKKNVGGHKFNEGAQFWEILLMYRYIF